MAVIECVEIESGNSGQWQLDQRIREYVRTFKVESNNPQDDPKTILSYGGIPALAVPYATATGSDSGAVVVSRDAKRDGNLTTWVVSINYSSKTPDPAKQDDNPLVRPPIWSFGFRDEEQVLTSDLFGNAIINSAGQPFSEPLTVTVGLPTIKIEVNKASINYQYALSLYKKVNAGWWNGFAPNQVRVDGLEISEQYENGGIYYKYSYSLSVKTAWNPVQILDQGFAELIPASSSVSSASATGWGTGSVSTQVFPQTLRTITDIFGHPLQQPSLLNGAGRKSNTPVYGYFWVYLTADFAGIP